MGILTSPFFVFMFMSSPLWLSALAYLSRKNPTVSKICWSYTLLLSILNLILYLSESPMLYWAKLFPEVGIWIFICSVIATSILNRFKIEGLGKSGYAFVFVVFTFFIFAVTMLVPVLLKSILGALVNIYLEITSTFTELIH